MAILFRYQHNWASSLKIDHEFKTSILTSRIYREQRIAERIAARKTVAIDLAIMGAGYTDKLQTIVQLLQAESIMPEFTRRLDLVSTGGSDPAEFALATVPGWIEPGATVVFDDGTNREAAVVASVAGSIVTLMADAAFDWFVGDGWVMPGLIGRFKQSVNISTMTSAAGKATMEFMVDPGDSHEEDTSAPLTFNGRELWMNRPNWLSPVGQDITGRLETLDFDRGVVSHYSPVTWNARGWKAAYVGKTSAEAEALLAFWHRLRGQQGEFYMPTWQDDLSLAIGAAGGASALVVPGTLVSQLFAGSPVYKAVMVLFRDGTYQANRVTAITDNGTNTTLTMAAPWGQAVNSTTALKVCWLPVWRSATDTLTIEWLTRTVAQCQMSFVAIEDL